ncbi:hypothetical protein KP509_11G059300 [Ceratopteris richardii]|uniref:Peptidase M14 domain-containing protein n=1 Tax=Ceratopteris richardii TaxID=49495 RepID=A0A8T2TRX7_CERRI|nr:hypothetical protein KP509_11G059300 [Ceratopteris richardii]
MSAVFVALLLLPVLMAETAEKKNITTINKEIYHQSDVLLQEIQAIASRNQEKMLIEFRKSEVDGYKAEIMVVTIQHGLNITMEGSKYRILLSFGQHGRELITSEVALRLIGILMGEKEPAIVDNQKTLMILQKMIIKIIPLENYNGRKIVETGQLCERKNGRGVDINRNWSIDWGKKEQDFDPAEEYPGSAPFSEPETRIMRDLADSFEPHLWINVHSGMQALFMPYDHKNDLPHPRFMKPMKHLLQELNQLHCYNSCVIGSGGGSVGYLAHGTATDYMYEALGVPLAFTFEIYGDSEAPSSDCFRMFNPVSTAMFENVVTNWSMAFVNIFTKLQGVLMSLPKAENDYLFGRNFRLRNRFGVRYSAGTREWDNHIGTLFEFILLFSISYLAFVWYMYRKRDRLSIPSLRATFPSSSN